MGKKNLSRKGVAQWVRVQIAPHVFHTAALLFRMLKHRCLVMRVD